MKVLGLFPGQGSQSVGMGADFIESWQPAREVFEIADETLGQPLSKLCLEGPVEKLTATQFSQPAILTVSTICYRYALSELGDQLDLTAAAGHSLGEYSALVAAEAIEFPDAVLLVHKRGQYMQAAVPAGEGRMIAVLAKPLEEIEAAVDKVKSGVVSVANVNAPGQIVVAGAAEAIVELCDYLDSAKVKELNVSAPFHCPLMQPAQDQLAVDLKQLSIKPPKCPVYANVSAEPLTDPESIRRALIEQVTGRVRWLESMERASSELPRCVAVEFGAGNVLSNMLKRIASQITRFSISKPDDVDRLREQ